MRSLILGRSVGLKEKPKKELDTWSRFLKSPETLRAFFAGVTIPFVSQERRDLIRQTSQLFFFLLP